MALASVVLGGFVAAILLASRADLTGGPNASSVDFGPTIQVSRPQVGSQPAMTTATATSVAPTSPPAPTPSPPTEQRFQVVNTDGEGVVLRASPNDRDWTPRGFMDGDVVTVVEREGADWAHVRGDNGEDGWVPARYLSR